MKAQTTWFGVLRPPQSASYQSYSCRWKVVLIGRHAGTGLVHWNGGLASGRILILQCPGAAAKLEEGPRVRTTTKSYRMPQR